MCKVHLRSKGRNGQSVGLQSRSGRYFNNNKQKASHDTKQGGDYVSRCLWLGSWPPHP